MPKVYTATLKEHSDFERKCSNCGHAWTASFDIVVTTSLESTSRAAAKTAESVMYEEKRDRFDNREVLCPQCSHFSEDAMYRHFRKGYVTGILKKYKRAAWANFATVLVGGWIPVLVFLVANLNPFSSDKPVLSVILLLVFLWFGGIVFYDLIGFVWALAALPSVRRKLDRLSDDALLDLAVDCYKKNKNSLHVSSFDTDLKWNSWLSGPLFLKAPLTAKATSSKDSSPALPHQ